MEYYYFLDRMLPLLLMATIHSPPMDTVTNVWPIQ